MRPSCRKNGRRRKWDTSPERHVNRKSQRGLGIDAYDIKRQTRRGSPSSWWVPTFRHGSPERRTLLSRRRIIIINVRISRSLRRSLCLETRFRSNNYAGVQQHQLPGWMDIGWSIVKTKDTTACTTPIGPGPVVWGTTGRIVATSDRT